MLQLVSRHVIENSGDPVIKFWGPILLTLWGPYRDFGAPFELALLARREVEALIPLSQTCQSAKHIVEGRRVEKFYYTTTQYGKCCHRQLSQMRHALPMTSI